MLKQVEIRRTLSNDIGTIGELRVDGKFIGYTVERPWDDNKPNVSCIPRGSYALKKCTTGKAMPKKYSGQSYEVQSVPGRSLIKFHIANWPKELQGCIAPNAGIDSISMAGSLSSIATKKFMDAMDGVEKAILVIKEA